MESIKIGVIGGSGLYNMPAISQLESLQVEDALWRAQRRDPQSAACVASAVAFVPRHGPGHALAPSSLPYRANIYALKSLGVRFIIAVNAVGSLRHDYAPGHIVTPDQIIDYTIHTPRPVHSSPMASWRMSRWLSL